MQMMMTIIQVIRLQDTDWDNCELHLSASRDSCIIQIIQSLVHHYHSGHDHGDGDADSALHSSLENDPLPDDHSNAKDSSVR